MLFLNFSILFTAFIFEVFFVCVFSLMLCRYEGFLKRAQAENFQDMANLGVFYTAGLDYMGRQIVVFVGKQFPASKIDLSKVFSCFSFCLSLLPLSLLYPLLNTLLSSSPLSPSLLSFLPPPPSLAPYLSLSLSPLTSSPLPYLDFPISTVLVSLHPVIIQL